MSAFRFAVAFLLLLALTGAALTQEMPGLVVFPPLQLDDDPRSEEVNRVVDAALRTGIFRLPVQAVQPPPVPEGSAGSDPIPLLTELARGVDARIALVTSTYVLDREVILSIAAVDTNSGQIVAGIFSRSLVGLTITNRVAEIVEQLTQELEAFLARGEREIRVAPIVLSIELQSVNEGMDVRIAGSTQGGLIQGGTLTLPFIPYPVGTPLAVDTVLAGFHPERLVVPLDSVATSAELPPLWRRTNRSIALNYAFLQLAGAGLGYREYFNPDQFFVGGDLYLYASLPQSERGEPVLHTDVTATVGRYFIFDYDRPFRFALAAGAGLIVTVPPSEDVDPYYDVYLNLVSPSFEWNTRQFILYVRPELKLPLGLGRNALGRQIIAMDEGPSPVTVGFAWKFGGSR